MERYQDLLRKLEAKTQSVLYYVGGASRDILLGQEPKDLDLATKMDAHQLLKALKPYALKEQRGLQQGVVMFNFEGYDLEIAQFRTEVYSDGSRKPEVKLTDSIEEDYKRRDFTINGIYLGSNFQPVFFGTSKEDLENKRVRIIGDENRYAQDPIRMLRHVRFALKLGDRAIEFPDSYVAEILRVADQRVWRDLELILKHPEGFARLGKKFRSLLLGVTGDYYNLLTEETLADKMGCIIKMKAAEVYGPLKDNFWLKRSLIQEFRRRYNWDNVFTKEVEEAVR